MHHTSWLTKLQKLWTWVASKALCPSLAPEPGCAGNPGWHFRLLAACLSEWSRQLWFPGAPESTGAVRCTPKPASECFYLGCRPARRPWRSGQEVVGVAFGLWKRDLGIIQSFCSTCTTVQREEDIMGCCSGRCTLAFICGMQLVSAKITIDPEWGGTIDRERFIYLFIFIW